MGEIIEALADRLRSISAAVANELTNLEGLRQRRLFAGLSPDAESSRIFELDAAITMAERNLVDLEKVRAGTEPVVESLRAAIGNVRTAERDLDRRRAEIEADQAELKVHALIVGEMWNLLEEALAAKRRAGTPSRGNLADLHGVLSRWRNGSAAAYIAVLQRGDKEKTVRTLEERLVGAREKLLQAVDAVTGE
jgi:hypothetical protein